MLILSRVVLEVHGLRSTRLVFEYEFGQKVHCDGGNGHRKVICK